MNRVLFWMNDNLTQDLYKDYAGLFFHDGVPTLRDHFECDDGWAGLISGMCKNIWRLQQLDKNLEVKFSCIKEKMGTMRIHADVGGSTNASIAQDIMDLTEVKSGRTCELTGSYGTLCVRNGWFKTLDSSSASELGFKPCK